MNTADSPASREVAREVNSALGNLLKPWKNPSEVAATTAVESKSLSDLNFKAGDLFKAWKPSSANPAPANPKSPVGRDLSQSPDAGIVAKNK